MGVTPATPYIIKRDISHKTGIAILYSFNFGEPEKWSYIRDACNASDQETYGIPATALFVFDGTYWVRARDAGSLTDAETKGIPAYGLFVFDGTNWVRARGNITEGLIVSVNSIRTTPEKVLDSVSIAASGTEEFTITADIYSASIITVSATYNASATSGVRVRWLYSPDNILFDSPEDAIDEGNYKDLTFSAGETRTRTIIIPHLQPYIKVQVVNLDSSYSVTVTAWKTFMK